MDTLFNMFPISVPLSQGDLEISSNPDSVATSESSICYDQIPDLSLLNSVINEPTDSQTDINVDLKEILTDLPEEMMDISSLLSFEGNEFDALCNEQFCNLSEIPVISNETICQNINNKSYTDVILVNEPVHTESQNYTAHTLIPADNGELDEVDDPGDIGTTCVDSAGKKYMEMRRKNNIASQKSRKRRKNKNLELAVTLTALEEENKTLFLLAEKLEKERDALQKKLLTLFSRK